jgi:hypothetical protein
MPRTDTDLAVIGGTPAGCAAALAAARNGLTVTLLEPTPALGGMNANGVHTFDAGTPEALSGIALEFAARVARHYAAIGLQDPLTQDGRGLYWEAHVAARIWAEMLAGQPGITVMTRTVPVDVLMEGTRIAAVAWEAAADAMGDLDADRPGARGQVRARLFLDATYEGDVAAWSGAPCRLGREPRSAAEPHAGHIHTAPLALGRADGFPPHTVLPGSTGAGDGRIMAFNIRLHLRFHEDSGPDAPHLVPAPPGYDPGLYRFDPAALRNDGTGGPLTGVNRAVNGKFLLNRGTMGNDLVGPNRDYVLARPGARRALRRRFVDHALGYLHFIQTRGGTPQLGLALDEFPENGHVPYRIYVREGRRIEGLATLTESDLHPWLHGTRPRPPRQPDAVAIGDWPIEIKRAEDAPALGYGHPEGGVFLRVARAPFQVPYGCLVPRGVDNLLVACALSATHVAYGAMRCEAVWFGTGLAAGCAAALALRHGATPAEVPVPALQEAIHAAGGKTSYLADVERDDPHFGPIQWAALHGLLPEEDRGFRYRPSHPATWGDLVEGLVVALDLPISVTGLHFEGLEPADRAFRFAETLYDLGSRADEELFPGTRQPQLDPQTEHYRPELRTRWLRLDPAAPVGGDAAAALARATLRALGRKGSPMAPPEPFTRGALAALLHRTAQGGQQ